MSSRWLLFVVAVLALAVGFWLGRQLPGGDPPPTGNLRIEQIGTQVRLTATAPSKTYLIVGTVADPVREGDAAVRLTPPAEIFELHHEQSLDALTPDKPAPCRSSSPGCDPLAPPPPYLVSVSGSLWGPKYKP